MVNIFVFMMKWCHDIMFDKELYFKYLNTLSFGKNIYIYDEVISTNDILLNNEFPKNSVVVTSLQTKGRGRSGRVWIDEGKSLIFSILLPELTTNMLMPLNIIAGYSVCDGISIYAPAKLKWPNDCVINNKKTSGMLLEASFTGNDTSKIVFGAGINVYNEVFPDDILYKATSVCLNTDSKVYKEIILAKILSSMEKMINDYVDNKLHIENLWHTYSAHLNKEISIHINGSKTNVIERGILPTGELIVEDINTKEIKNINLGEIGYDFNS